MIYLQEVSDFVAVDFIDEEIEENSPSLVYYYQGFCPQTGELLRLPRTKLVEDVACGLMKYLAADEWYSREGKMYGILLVKNNNGEKKILKAFSGLLNGCSEVEGWVPPIPGKELVEWDENLTLKKLADIKQEIITLQQIPQRQQYQILALDFSEGLEKMNSYHQECKQKRQEKRLLYSQTMTGKALSVAIEQLDQESRQQGIERKLLKRDRNRVLEPLKKVIDDADTQVRNLKKQRQELSRKLQTQMHAVYSLMNFFGRSQTLKELFPGGLPTGTGECCAPKLLHYAATHNLKPLAMAEFWWGSSQGDKIQGNFYGACVERCQPLMGFLLSGLNKSLSSISSSVVGKDVSGGGVFSELPIIYEDEWLIAINKPSGLLSVPGRYSHNQDSVVSRLRNLLVDRLTDGQDIKAVHRLDRDTNGILLLAKDVETHRLLSQQFEKREVEKLYQAVLWGSIEKDNGIIDLPLWGNPNHRPYQEVNWQYGKPCITEFQVVKRVIEREVIYTHIEFKPFTGRTHQLRVHAADKKGLNAPILGDKLYGDSNSSEPLHLQAKKIRFMHPYLKEELCLECLNGWW